MGGPGSGARPQRRDLVGYAQAARMRKEGKKSHEIGKALGVPASTIRNWFHRARLHRSKDASPKRRHSLRVAVGAHSAETVFDRYLEVGRRLGFESAVRLLKAVREM